MQVLSARSILFYFFCFSLLFENTSLSSIGGVFTAPLGFVFVLAYLFFFTYRFFELGRLSNEGVFVIAYLFFLLLYSFLVSFLYIDKYDYTFLIDRGLRFFLLVLPSVVVFFIVQFYSISVINNGIVLLFWSVIFVFIANLAIPDLFNSISFFQSTPAYSPDRMRGFTFEASHFGFQLALVVLLFTIARKCSLLYLLPFLILAIVFTTSKGTLIALVISLGVTYLFFAKFNFFTKLLVSVPFGILVFFLLYLQLYDIFLVDVEKYGSTATRTSVVLTSILTLFPNPFGSGFFGFLPEIYEKGGDAITILENIFPNLLNFDEFLLYLTVGTTDGVSTKTFFFDWLIFGGVIFLCGFFVVNIRMVRGFYTNKSKLDFLLAVFLIISVMFFMTIDTHYIAAFSFSYLYKRSKGFSHE